MFSFSNFNSYQHLAIFASSTPTFSLNWNILKQIPGCHFTHKYFSLFFFFTLTSISLSHSIKLTIISCYCLIASSYSILLQNAFSQSTNIFRHQLHSRLSGRHWEGSKKETGSRPLWGTRHVGEVDHTLKKSKHSNFKSNMDQEEN